MKRLTLIPVVTLMCLLGGCSSPDTSGGSELPIADCEKLISFPSNFNFNPWEIHESRRNGLQTIEEHAKEKGIDVGDPYYVEWKSRYNASIDDLLIQIEASAGKDSVEIQDDSIKSAMESVASSASPGNLGTLEGLFEKCATQIRLSQ
jgi:hypothetical protein